ncbi:MAG: hypothetical protein JOY78_00815 [Pseudonocardia sp.]|nr:hypothetical protein [Pseudonocardia sp.]
MDTSSRTASTVPADTTPSIPAARLELRWSLRHTRGRASTLIGKWVVVEPMQEQQLAA